jgi:hypothetical protein
MSERPGWVTRHGVSEYRNGCRCEECVAANYTAQKKWRGKVRDTPAPESAHGTSNGYQVYRCRCDRCAAWSRERTRKAWAAKKRMRLLVEAGLPRNWEGEV